MKKLIIRAVKTNGGYIAIADNDDMPYEGRLHPSAIDAYRDLALSYPANSTWAGKKISTGYEIVID